MKATDVYRGFIPRSKHNTPNWEMLMFGRWKLLVVMPSADAYGRFLLDILMSLHVAHEEGAVLCFLRPVRQARYNPLDSDEDYRTNRAFLGVQVERVRSLTPDTWPYVIAVGLWKLKRLPLPRVLERCLRLAGKNRWFAREPPPYEGPYLRRALLRDPLDISMPEDVRLEGEQRAAELGVRGNDRIVVLHVRDSGLDKRLAKQNRMSRRSANIGSYRMALNLLVDRGYKVVRIGDPTMRPVRMEGVIDLATSARRHEGLELYFIMRSSFFVGCDAGPSMSLNYVGNSPILLVNATHPIFSYPIRRNDRYILKKVVDRATGMALSPADMLEERFLLNFNDVECYEFIENSCIEIASAVAEFLDVLDGTETDSQEQIEWGRNVYDVAAGFSECKSTRRWGLDKGFLGDGLIGRTFIEGRMRCAE